MEEIKIIKDGSKVNVEGTIDDKAECFYLLAVTLIGIAKDANVTESQLTEAMSELWEGV